MPPRPHSALPKAIRYLIESHLNSQIMEATEKARMLDHFVESPQEAVVYVSEIVAALVSPDNDKWTISDKVDFADELATLIRRYREVDT